MPRESNERARNQHCSFDRKTIGFLTLTRVGTGTSTKGTKRSYRWVQQAETALKRFRYTLYADKLWHFFWNAYKRLDGTSAWKLDAMGILYEMKTDRKRILTGKGLSRDAKQDITFNRGGIAFANWLNKHHPAISRAIAAKIRDRFVATAKQTASFNRLSRARKAVLIDKLMKTPQVEMELRRLSYPVFADGAGGIVSKVKKWSDRMPR